MRSGILGLDLARKYGWAYIGPDGGYIESGARELDSAAPIGEQMHRLSMSISDLIDEFAPDWVAIEKPIHGGKFTAFGTALKLYGYAAVAAMVTHIHELGFVQLQRSSCCKAILGSGKAKKADGIAYVRRNFVPLCNSDDQADAILVALTAHKMRQQHERTA